MKDEDKVVYSISACSISMYDWLLILTITFGAGEK